MHAAYWLRASESRPTPLCREFAFSKDSTSSRNLTPSTAYCCFSLSTSPMCLSASLTWSKRCFACVSCALEAHASSSTFCEACATYYDTSLAKLTTWSRSVILTTDVLLSRTSFSSVRSCSRVAREVSWRDLANSSFAHWNSAPKTDAATSCAILLTRACSDVGRPFFGAHQQFIGLCSPLLNLL